jgi:type IV pilus assembly protein PilY1
MTATENRKLFLLASLLLVSPLVSADHAFAQGSGDVRDLRPAVMLLLDTSGSMERKPGCGCTTEACEECFPDCAAHERSKWNMVLEAFTGSWGDAFTCARQARPEGTYDSGYSMPHFNHPAPTIPQADGVLDTYATRVLFGLMTFDSQPTWDGQREVVPVSAWNEASSLGAAGHYSYADNRDYGFPGCTLVQHRVNLGARGGGPVGPLISTGTGDIAVNQSVQDALVGAGAYHEIRPYGPTPLAAMLSDYAYYLGNHPDMQESGGDPLLACRPRYALVITDGYPNADLRGAPMHCEVEAADNPFGCPYQRPEEIVAELCQVQSGRCTGSVDGVFVLGFDVPDDAARERLSDLADLGGTADAYFAVSAEELRTELETILALTGITAPGLEVTSRTPPVLTNASDGFHAQYNSGYRQLEDGPWEGILERRRFECTDDDVPEPQPIGASDRFQDVISAQGSRVLRTVIPDDACDVRGHLTGDVMTLPSIGFGGSGGGGNGNGNGRGGGGRGNGGKNTSCSTSKGGNPHNNTPSCPAPQVDPGEDAYGESCSIPSGTDPAETDLALVPFSASNDDLTASHLFLPNANVKHPSQAVRDALAAQREDILGWVGGANRDNDLGAIQHSTPVIVGKPQEIADESFNLFRQKVIDRPTVLYVGTSDGILHCISAIDQEGTVDGEHYSFVAGQELWGFVPPALFPNLQAARQGHQPMMDGTPVVREIFDRRKMGADPDGDIYHTILLTGFRGGGAGYLALDVTNPTKPKFLWQFAHPDMGDTYGQPALAQVAVEVNDGGARGIEERAIAILPGGGGDELSNALGCGKCYICNGVAQLETPTAEQIANSECVMNEPLGCNSNGVGTPPANGGTINAREHKRCWSTRGRHMFFVDPLTGELVGHLDDTVFGAPLVGGVAAFSGETGTLATAAYTTDADGVIWRIDLSSARTSDWGATPLFDMYWRAPNDPGGAADAQPAFEAPLVTTDAMGNAVIIQATGNLDVYDAFTTNKVVSITERYSIQATVNEASGGSAGSVDVSFLGADGQSTIGADLNWQITLRPSEQVTGPLSLFDGRVYFATFTGLAKTDDACAMGESRIWGVHYVESIDPNQADAEDLDPQSRCIDIQPTTMGSTSSPSQNLMAGVRWPKGVLGGITGADTAGRCLGTYENQIILGTQVAQRSTCFDLVTADHQDPYIGPYSHVRSTAPAGGGFQLVAVTSGGTSPISGSSLGELTQTIQTPIQYTRAAGTYAGRAE